MSKVAILPVWKKNATAEERLLELAGIAREHPERFSRYAFIYQEEDEEGTITRECYSENISTVEALGILEMGKLELLLRTRGLIA